MKYIYRILFVLLFMLVYLAGMCQRYLPDIHNLNADNGLPDNKVYGLLSDKYGYLWIGTPKGVVRYNGYSCRTFNLSDGLPSEDVWQMVEDCKGRIWLGSISNSIGYIKNNTYHKCYSAELSGIIYPRNLRDNKGDILFETLYQGETDQYSICLEQNDIIRKLDIHEADFKEIRDSIHEVVAIFMSQNGSPQFVYNNRVYESTKLLPDMIQEGKLSKKMVWTLPDSFSDHYQSYVKIRFQNSVINYKDGNGGTWIDAYDLSKKTVKHVDLNSFGLHEPVEYIFHSSSEKSLYVITKSRILVFDATFHLQATMLVRDYITNPMLDGNYIRAIGEDAFGRVVLGTTNNGVWIHYGTGQHFKKSGINLPDFHFVGKLGNHAYLWNAASKKLAILEGQKLISVLHRPDFAQLHKLIPYGSDTMIALSKYIFLYKNGYRIPVFYNNAVSNTTDGIKIKDTVFLISTYGFCKIAGANFRNIVDYDRYTAISSDPLRKTVWAYNDDKVCIYRNGNLKYISGDSLHRLGISRLKKVVHDSTYGNIFFKGYDNIIVSHPEKKLTRSLFNNFNTEDALLTLHKNKVIVAGRFGVLFATIRGAANVSQPVVYQNIKDVNYKYVRSMHAYDTVVLLQTDRGLLSVSIPQTDTPSILYKPRLLAYYKDSAIAIAASDTIIIDPSNLSFTFDLINPAGNGTVKYKYRIPGDSVWHRLSTNQMVLPGNLEPGIPYAIHLSISDNTWKSDEIIFHIVVAPYWWQTASGRRMIWAGVLLVLLTLFATAVLITRKLVNRANQRRTQLMEMELKAIYSQINPHFIFNSLNSALLLVSKNKMEEAYDHISKFSRLLRSYLRASRNKLISIADEINNLEDYIELQQARFKSRFSYHITVSNDLPASQVKIPSLLIQPFVENAINHGLLSKVGKGQLSVSFKYHTEKGLVECIVDDDGVGRATAKEQKDIVRGSYGDLLIKDLVGIFNRYEHMNIDIEYHDKIAPLTGTTVYIRIKTAPHEK